MATALARMGPAERRRELRRRGRRWHGGPISWLVSRWACRKGGPPALAEIERYCMFIGYPRSSHSLVGSLLDAHPEVIIAHEQDALRHLRPWVSRAQFFYLLLENSRRFTQAGRSWTGYSYAVPGQYQGRYTRLRVIGDKRGAQSNRRLMHRPALLEGLRDMVDVPLRVIHVSRNPFDNIATMAFRDHGGRDEAVDEAALRSAARQYFTLVDNASAIRGALGPGEFIDLRIDDFIAAPRPQLARLCAFLGVEAEDAYLDACATIVFDRPRRSRDRFRWPPELRAEIEAEIAASELLAGYSF